MRSALLLIAAVGLCLCAAQAATPAPMSGVPDTSSANIKAVSSTGAAVQTTIPKVAGLPADTPSLTGSKSTATSPTGRSTTPRPPTTPPTSAAPTTKATAGGPTKAPTTFDTLGSISTPNLTTTVSTPWPNVTVFDTYSPTESRTPDIDPGMTPYAGATPLELAEPTATGEVQANVTSVINATPTDLPTVQPFFTVEVVESPPFELPPGAYEYDLYPSPTETVAPIPTLAPGDTFGSSFLPRWFSYLLFIFLGVSGVACVALIGSHLGLRPPSDPVPRADSVHVLPGRAWQRHVLQPGVTKITIEQQALVDRIAGFEPQSQHVERLGRDLLILEQSVQISARDRSIRLGRLINYSAVPSDSVPAPATAWAGAHGFRVLAVDGGGMALVMPALSSTSHSVLGVLPIGEMVEGASPVPMPIRLPGKQVTGSAPALLADTGDPPNQGTTDPA